MKSNKPITLPPDDRRYFHFDGVNGTRIEDLVDNLFFIQDLLAQAIKSQAQAEALDILTLAELSRDYTHIALNITRTLQAKQALEAPQNEWSLLLAQISLELEEEEL